MALARHVNSQDLPKIIKPSPEVSSLLRFLDHPVSYSAGVPQISVPLYEIKSGSLSVPINITFHAGGRRASDVAGPIGFGWSLNAGGVMARTINGKPDELVAMVSNVIDRPNQLLKNNYDYISALYNQHQAGTSYGNTPPQQSFTSADYEYDIYSYSFVGNSGKFIYKRNPDSTYLMPWKPYIVNFERIIDDVGNTYTFNQAETYTNHPQYGSLATSKLLTSIVSADKKDTIKFIYESLSQIRTTQIQSYTVYDDYTSQTLYTRLYGQNTYRNDISLFREPYNVQRLKEIKFKNGSVLFNANPLKAVDEMLVRNLSGGVLKSVKFNRVGGSTDYQLSQVQFKDNQGHIVEQYGFDYYTSPMSGQDYYGFVNSMAAGVPFHNVSFERFGGGGSQQVGTVAHRHSSIAATHGMIKKIIYPTGGSAEYSYELNTAALGALGNSVTCGGIRVSKIKTTDNNGNSSYKTYKYGINQVGLNECNYGSKQIVIPENTLNGGYEMLSYESHFFPSISMISIPLLSRTSPGDENYRKRVYTGSFLSDIIDVGQEPVFYSCVTEYDGISENDNNGKTVFLYDGTMNSSNSNYAVATYPSTPYTPSINISFSSPPYSYNFSGINTDPNLRRYHISRYDLWKSKPLKKKTVFKRIGPNNTDSSYQRVKETENLYTYTTTNTLKGIHLSPYCETEANVGGYNWNRFAAVNCELPVFLWDNYTITIGKEELTRQEETTFTELGDINSITEYIYNNKYLVSEIKRTLSDNKIKVSKIKYPADFSGDAVLSSMAINNMVNIEVEKSELIDNALLSTTKTDFANWGNNILAPKVIKTHQVGTTEESRLDFHNYDNQGNVLSVSKTQGPKICYVYSYSGQYPIAKIENAAYSDVIAALSGASQVEFFRDLVSPSDQQVKSFLAPLHIALPNAMITSYTYKPLVGMTSETDVKGRTTYYDYDGFGRLQRIRDHEDHVIKQFCYNYAGQAIDCAPAMAVTIYARVELENVQTTNDNVDGYVRSVTYADEYIRFYSDAACTQPYTLTSNLSVSHTTSSTYSSNGGSSTSSYTGTITVPAGSSSFYSGNNETYYYEEYGWDPYWGNLYDMYSYDYGITSGAGYQSAATIIR